MADDREALRHGEGACLYASRSSQLQERGPLFHAPRGRHGDVGELGGDEDAVQPRGCTSPITKYWLFDVDDKEHPALGDLREALATRGVLRGEIPSKKGVHLIAEPFDTRGIVVPADIAIHKDNPTNLYIPDGAD